jgi:hypothetical protein
MGFSIAGMRPGMPKLAITSGGKMNGVTLGSEADPDGAGALDDTALLVDVLDEDWAAARRAFCQNKMRKNADFMVGNTSCHSSGIRNSVRTQRPPRYMHFF